MTNQTLTGPVEREAYRVTIVGSIGNLALLVVKFVAGFVGNSAAMVADAVHSLSDFVTDIVVLVFVKISAKPSDKSHDYGHGKFETLATIIIALMLMVVGVGILWSGCVKIWDFCHGVELEAPGMIALIAALLSIVVKELLYRYTIRASRRLKLKVLEANAWHHRSDAMSSIGTTLGISGAIFLGANGRVLDPVAAVVVSVFIIRVAYRLMAPGFDELMERSLPDDIEGRIIDIVNTYPDVSSPHNLRSRRIGNNSAVEIHIRVPAEMTVGCSHEITRSIERDIRELLGQNSYITIHVEPVKQPD